MPLTQQAPWSGPIESKLCDEESGIWAAVSDCLGSNLSLNKLPNILCASVSSTVRWELQEYHIGVFVANEVIALNNTQGSINTVIIGPYSRGLLIYFSAIMK